MPQLIAAFLALCAVTLFGVLLVQIIQPKMGLLEQMAIGYLFGIGLFTFILFLLNLVRIPYAVVPASITLLTLISITAITVQLTQRPNWVELLKSKIKSLPNLKNLTSAEKVPFILLLILILIALVISAYWPVKDWDSIVLYDFRAKTFVQTGYMDAGIKLGYFFGYPLLTSGDGTQLWTF